MSVADGRCGCCTLLLHGHPRARLIIVRSGHDHLRTRIHVRSQAGALPVRSLAVARHGASRVTTLHLHAAQEAAERAAAWGTSGCHVTPATASSCRPRSTSRRMTSTITNPVPGKQMRPPDTPLLALKRQAGEQLLRDLNERANLRLLHCVDPGKPGYPWQRRILGLGLESHERP
jgi:hypothetical protein